MKISITSILLLISATLLTATDFSQLSFGTDHTLDIVTWNIEHFPKNDTSTVDEVKSIILQMDADIIALQEVSDTAKFTKMVSELEGYGGCYGHYYYMASAYIYKTDVLTVNSVTELFARQWKIFPRPPYLLDVSYKGEHYYVINNHYKCCGDGRLDKKDKGDQEYIRAKACQMLKSYIDKNLGEEKVIVVGDMNDIITDDKRNNVFQEFIDDENSYLFADMDIALGDTSQWSYPSWPSHLDHILITNELFDNSSKAQCIKLDDYFGSWSKYDTHVSDHRPMGIKISDPKTH